MTLRSSLAAAAFLAALLATLVTPAPARAENPITAAPPTPSGRWHDASLDEYRTHLQDLIPVLDACAKARDQKTCDPNLIGPDDRIAITLFYYDQRIRREGYDIERLMESAGMTADLTPPAGEGITAPPIAEEQHS